MTNCRKPIFRLGVVLLVAGTFTIGVAVLAQSPATPGTGAAQAAPAASQRLAFEVAAIKPSHSISHNGGSRWTPDSFTATNMRLKDLIQVAYNVKGFQVSGGPAWVSSDGYDIDAKIGGPFEKLSGSERMDHIRLMLQSLLADRFKLVLRKETRTFPVYRLVVAKNGSKLSAATKQGSFSERNGQIKAQGITMETLAEILSGPLERNVMDETHLSGLYDVSLRWSPDNGAASAPGPLPAGAQPGALQPDSITGSIFTAIQEQLGLKLKAAKAPVETLVIVSAERPSEN